MFLVADESVDFGIIDKLRQNGINVLFITENNSGIDDTEVLRLANDKDNLLITEDKDFGELVYRLKLKYKGILLIRLSELPRTLRIRIASEIIIAHFEKLENSFSVLTPGGLRIKSGFNKSNKS